MSGAASMSLGEKARLWGVAVRAFSFPASIAPVLLGTVYAYHAGGMQWGGLNWLHFILALVAGVLFQTGCNLINDYYDYAKGIDREGNFGGSGVLVSKTMSPRDVISGAYTALFIGSLIGLYFVSRLGFGSPAGMWMLGIGVAGALGAIWYTTGNGSAKYNALGTPLVFLLMGPGYVLGAYLIQTGQVGWNAVLVSLPIGFLVTAILQANDTRDIVDDGQCGIKTAAILLGPTGARAYYSFLLFAPYLCLILLAVAKLTPWLSLLPLITLPLAFPLHRVFWTVRDLRHEALTNTPEGTAKLHLAFGVLLSLGILIGHLVHF